MTFSFSCQSLTKEQQKKHLTVPYNRLLHTSQSSPPHRIISPSPQITSFAPFYIFYPCLRGTIDDKVICYSFELFFKMVHGLQ